MDKTKEELLAEIAELTRRIDILEKAEAGHRKTVGEALRESEAKYRRLVDIAPAGIYEIDLTTGKFIRVNDVMCEYTGYTKEEFLNRKVWDILYEQSLKKNIERNGKMLER